jgi:integrase
MAHIRDRWEAVDPATGEKRRTARYGKGARYLAAYRGADGRERTKVFPDRAKKQAELWLAQQTAAQAAGAWVDPRRTRTTLAAHVERWRERQMGREGTARIRDNALDKHILPRLGDRALVSIERGDVQALVKALQAKGLAAGTVRNVYEVLARVLADAVLDRALVTSPCVRIALPSRDAGEAVPPTRDEVRALADAVGERYRAVVVLLAGSGLRIGEALGLDVEHVDFLRRTVRVERQRLQDGQIGPTKTASSTRTIPVGGVVIDELAAHLAAFPSAGPLFTTEAGEPLAYRRWKALWRRAQQATGLDVDTHALRHYTASVLLSGGASVKQVQTLLGHSSAAVTLRVYAHLVPGDDDRARAVMDSALSARDADQSQTMEVRR